MFCECGHDVEEVHGDEGCTGWAQGGWRTETPCECKLTNVRH